MKCVPLGYLLLGVLGLVLLSTSAYCQGSGKSLPFNGQHQYVDLGDQVANGVRTIEMWFKPAFTIDSGLRNPGTLIVRDFNYGDGASTEEFGLEFYNGQFLNKTGALIFFRRVGSTLYLVYSDNTYWEAGRWYHVAAVISPIEGMQMFVNGVLQRQTNPSTQPIGTISGAASDRVSIGRWGALDIRYFHGEIDEVRLWETGRTAQEIRQYMCRKLPASAQGLRAYWNWDQVSDHQAPDLSTKGFGATLKNMSAQDQTFSGAPIGDESAYAYSNNSYQLQLQNTSNTIQMNVSYEAGPMEGAHLYRVNERPNSLTGVVNPMENNYFGVFLTHHDATYRAKLSSVSCNNCLSIFTRNDNAKQQWQIISAIPEECGYPLLQESKIDDGYRAEYLLGKTQDSFDQFSLGKDTVLCQGASMILAPTITGNYTWQDGSSASTFSVRQPGKYWLTVADRCSSYTDTIEVKQFVSDLSVDLGEDKILCSGEVVPLVANAPSASHFLWQDGTTTADYLVKAPGTYTVTVSDKCTSVTYSITFLPGEKHLLIPNVFTPNEGDQINRYFHIEGLEENKYNLFIYNRWGTLVYAEENYANKWEGAGVPTGTYYYLLKDACANKDYLGWVSIIR